jgi:deoxyinosine 3'endonuclease (endonuclease V)
MRMMVAETHPWAVSIQDAFQIQKELTRELLFEDDTDDPALIAGVDVAFSRGRDLLYAAIVVLDAETMQPVEVASAAQQPVFPYVPGLLRLREVQARGRVQGAEAEARRDADPQSAQEEGRRRVAD